MDVLIFIGQSNMQGSTGEKDNSLPVENAYEFKLLTNTLTPLVNPVGEDIGDNLLASSALGNGSLIPSFCKEYSVRTKKKIVAIHTAKGDTSIVQWLKGTERFEMTISKIKSGIDKVKEVDKVGNIFVIWLQGESDALKFTGTTNYLKMLIDFKNDLKKEIHFNKFALIQQGHFAEFAPWINESVEKKKQSDKEIMDAILLAPKEDKDFVLLTRVCSKLSLNKKYLNAKEFGPHYNNLGMNIIGKKAGKKLASISLKNNI